MASSKPFYLFLNQSETEDLIDYSPILLELNYFYNYLYHSLSLSSLSMLFNFASFVFILDLPSSAAEIPLFPSFIY